MSFRSKALVITLLVVACFAVAYFLTIPKWDAYKVAQNQLATLQNQNKVLTDSLATVQSFVDTFNQHQQDVTTLNLALPAKSTDSANFTNSLNQISQSSGIALGALQISEPVVSVDNPPAPNSIQVEVIHFSGSGSYASFRDFLSRLENNLRLIDVNKISFKADDLGQVEFDVDGQTYFQK